MNGPRAQQLAHALGEAAKELVDPADTRLADAAVDLDAADDPDWGERFARLQSQLRPGGLLVLGCDPRQAVALGRRAAHYFEPDTPSQGEHRTLLVFRPRPLAAVVGHFDTVAPGYATQIPPHVRNHYLARKLSALERMLGPGWTRGLGLDLGCGLGWYANAIAARGGRVVAMDPSTVPLRIGQKESARGSRPLHVAGDTLRLPFQHGAFDYAYAVNMLHHLKRGEQERALREVHRVLKPGAPFLVFEINTRNPLFAWYMRHVFPRTRSIDRGDEEFIRPDRLPLVPEFEVERVEYSTFAPDFIPRAFLPAARAAERLLERAIPRYAIHYTALLRRR